MEICQIYETGYDDRCLLYIHLKIRFFMIKKDNILIGCHVSISGGFFKAIDEGIEIGCTAIQIFTKSNRQWKAKAIIDDDIQALTEQKKNSNISLIVAHASYLINLGSITPEVQEKSYIALIDEIKRCQKLGIPYLVLHPGTAELSNKKETIKRTGQYINQALQATSDCSTTVLIETMAGQGKSIGSIFEEIASMIDQVENKKRIGVCFDTCHAFVAGYDISTKNSYEETFQHFDQIIGLHYLKMFHINDSKKERGSHVDRHEDIGKGTIGLQGFTFIMNDPRFIDIPKILETPVTENEIKDHQRNLQTLLSLLA